MAVERIPVDFYEPDEDGYVFGSSEPGPDGCSTYLGAGLYIKNPFEDIGEEYATDESVKRLQEMIEEYKGASVSDISHLDPRGPYYSETIEVEFAVDYKEAEGDEEATQRLMAETDWGRLHNDAQYLYTFRDRFAESCGINSNTLEPYASFEAEATARRAALGQENAGDNGPAL